MTSPQQRRARLPQVETTSIRAVYGRLTAEQAGQVLDLWQRHRAVEPGPEAEERLRQVVCIYLDRDGIVVGVNTVYPVFLPSRAAQFLAYRLFIQPGNRTPGVMRRMTILAYQTLRDADLPDKPAGLLVRADNSKLMRPGLVAMLERHGLEVLDDKHRDRQVWIWPF